MPRMCLSDDDSTEILCSTAHGQGPDLRSIARDMPMLARERDAISLARQECASGVDTEFTSGCASTQGHRLDMSVQAFGYQRLPDGHSIGWLKKSPFFRSTSTRLGCSGQHQPVVCAALTSDWARQDEITGPDFIEPCLPKHCIFSVPSRTREMPNAKTVIRTSATTLTTVCATTFAIPDASRLYRVAASFRAIGVCLAVRRFLRLPVRVRASSDEAASDNCA